MGLENYKYMIEEEIDRKKRALKGFKDDIKNNNRKPIYFKVIKGKQYIYINDGQKGNFHYKLLGSVDSFSKKELEDLKFNSDKNKDNLIRIKNIKKDLFKLEKISKILNN